jgi:PAS domain S-box-containing protein
MLKNPPPLKTTTVARSFVECVALNPLDTGGGEFVVLNPLDTAEGEFVALNPLDTGEGEFVLLNPIHTAEGDEFVLSSITDITDREHAEERGQREFKILADLIPDLVWMARPDGHIFWYNQRWYDYTGTTFEETQGWGWQSVHDPRELPKVLEQWRGCIATGEPFDMLFPLKGKDGVFHPFRTRAVPIKNAQGDVERWCGTTTELTELKRAEELEQLMIAVVQSAEDVILTKGLDGIVRSLNPAAELMLGYRAEEIVGESVMRLIPVDRQHEEAMILDRLARGQRVAHLETVRRRKDGSLIDVSLTISPICDDQGAIVGASKVMRDITERNRAEADLSSRCSASAARVEVKLSRLPIATMTRPLAAKINPAARS